MRASSARARVTARSWQRRSRLCARRARYYRRLFCHYKDTAALHVGVKKTAANLTLYAAVEQAYKRSSTHRSALDLCSGFISRILRRE